MLTDTFANLENAIFERAMDDSHVFSDIRGHGFIGNADYISHWVAVLLTGQTSGNVYEFIAHVGNSTRGVVSRKLQVFVWAGGVRYYARIICTSAGAVMVSVGVADGLDYNPRLAYVYTLRTVRYLGCGVVLIGSNRGVTHPYRICRCVLGAGGGGNTPPASPSDAPPEVSPAYEIVSAPDIFDTAGAYASADERAMDRHELNGELERVTGEAFHLAMSIGDGLEFGMGSADYIDMLKTLDEDLSSALYLVRDTIDRLQGVNREL